MTTTPRVELETGALALWRDVYDHAEGALPTLAHEHVQLEVILAALQAAHDLREGKHRIRILPEQIPAGFRHTNHVEGRGVGSCGVIHRTEDAAIRCGKRQARRQIRRAKPTNPSTDTSAGGEDA